MSVWDTLRKAKKAGQRFLDRVDEVEREAREGDADAVARRMVFQSSETELSGGVADLEGLGLDQPGEEGAQEGEELELHLDALEEGDTSHSFFADLQPHHVDEEPFERTQVGTQALTVEGTPLGDLTQTRELTGTGEIENTGEFTHTGEYTTTGEKTATGEKTVSLRGDWANSLGFDEQELTKILRSDHYPQLSEQPLQLLVQLSRYEQSLMGLGEELGRACRALLQDVLPQDEDWEAAVWTTGAHWDHAVRSALAGMEEDSGPANARTLGWAFWPFTDELLAAAVGLQDPCGVSVLIASIERVLDARWAHVSGGAEDLEAEGDHLPIRPRGVFAFEGFQWEA